MEELYRTDYKLDQGFLLSRISESLIKGPEENSDIHLPVRVQFIEGGKESGEWSSFQVTDGESEIDRCAFLSKQSLPDYYSILKINKISHLPSEISEYIRDYSEDGHLQYLLGEIEFEIEVSGEKIGHRLYEIKPNKYLDIVELLSRKDVLGDNDFMESLTFESPSVKLMKSMWRNRGDKFCDVSFTFSDDQDSQVFAHKSVLISVSDVFEAHFNRQDYRDGGSVNIVDTSFYYFNKLLEFIYTDNVQYTTVDVVFELLYLSKKYLLRNLEYQCQATIIDHYDFDHDSIFNLLTLNHKSNDKYVQDYLTTQIQEETRGVINLADFLKCDYETVEWIFSMEELHIDEFSLLCALYKWAFHNQVNAFCNDANEVVNQDAECLHGLLECIHFQYIDGEHLDEEFAVVVSTTFQYLYTTNNQIENSIKPIMVFLKELYRPVDLSIDNDNREPSDTECGSTEDDERDSEATTYSDSDVDDPAYQDFLTFRKEMRKRDTEKEEQLAHGAEEEDAQLAHGAEEGEIQLAHGAEGEENPTLPQTPPTPPAPPNSPLQQPLALRSFHQRLEAPPVRTRGRGRGRKKRGESV